jgi:exoribonuclease-2
MRNFELTYKAYSEFQIRMERYWCLQYLIQENVQEIHATVWRENLVRLDSLPYMTKVYGMPELKSGTRVSLQVQDVDTLMMELRTKFLRVLEEEPVQPLVLDDAEGEALDIEAAAAVTAEAVITEPEIVATEATSADAESKGEAA